MAGDEELPTQDMLTAGGRSIGRTMRETNHYERARDCWDSMIRAKETGELGDIPVAGGR